MCGIVAYIGNENSKDVILRGLERLEYRGYDSAGIAVMNQNKELKIFKEKGRIAELRKIVDQELFGRVGIGHTRWATHGEPNQKNAHPHESWSGRFVIVHNGVIENYKAIKKEFLQDVALKSDTDSEIIAQLLEVFSEKATSTEEAFRKTLTVLKGSYAIALLDKKEEDTIYIAKNKSPLLIGIGNDCYVVASSAMAGIELTKKFVELQDEEMGVLKRDAYLIKDLKGNLIQRLPFVAELDSLDIEKGTYPHYMLKEIDEQPAVIRRIIQKYQENPISRTILDEIERAERIHIIACGTSYHAGLIGKQYFEKITNKPAEVHVASEFAYNMPMVGKNPLFVFISQSGETADSRAVLVAIKEKGFRSLTITNVQGSTLSREADHTLLLHAGPEIAVASTKAYTAQIAVLLILASSSQPKNELDIYRELSLAANAMEVVCEKKKELEQLAKQFLQASRNAFYIGRTFDYYVSLEAALKLKEVSYIQTEGFAAGELKHGTIALIEKGTPVFAICTQQEVNLNIRGNVKEVLSRGANVCVISVEGCSEDEDQFVLPVVHPWLTPLVAVVPTQLIAYYAALQRGCDIDKPKNLAKSVTVE